MSKHRRRVLVALIPGAELIGRIEAISSLFGRPPNGLIPPHITVVPPLNLSESDVNEALGIVRRVASRSNSFRLHFAGLASFAPAARTIHLAIADPSGELDRLREQLRVGPLLRLDSRPYRPHVTLLSSASEELIESALALETTREDAAILGSGWLVDRVFTLEQSRSESGTVWQIIADDRFMPPTVVGRGGVEMTLRCVEAMEPATAQLLAQSEVLPAGPEGGAGDRLCVTAELADAGGVPAGVALGRVEGRSAWLDVLFTALEHRREGVARHVLAQWCFEAANCGATVVLCRTPEKRFLQEMGFGSAGGLLVRELQ